MAVDQAIRLALQIASALISTRSSSGSGCSGVKYQLAASNRKSVVGISAKSVDGASGEDLLVGGESGVPGDWSSDWRFVLYTDTARGIWAVSTEGIESRFQLSRQLLGRRARSSPGRKVGCLSISGIRAAGGSFRAALSGPGSQSTDSRRWRRAGALAA